MPVESRSFIEVVQDVVSNIQDIVRSEIRLARAEMTIEAKQAARAAGVIAAGALLALYCLGFLFLAAVYALATVLPGWGAALIVFGGLLVIAITLIAIGRARMKLVHAKPETTIQSVKENVEWLKSQTR
ncbi:MAG: phage holin family protein [Bryobacterales bacterium]|nr:phage holin family protein [Bryobacterales bacterium]MBV9397845.1 phage holin family protein [Bryobacterales bacterium]